MNTIEQTAALMTLDELEKFFQDGKHILGGRFTMHYQRQMREIINARYEQVIYLFL